MAEERKLTDEEALGLLQQDAWSLHKEVKDIDYEIEREIRTHADGFKDSMATIARLKDRYEIKLDLMYKVGRLSVHTEQAEERVRASQERTDQHREDPQPETPTAHANHLDWLQPVLNGPEPTVEQAIDGRHQQIEGEERTLGEAEGHDLPDRRR